VRTKENGGKRMKKNEQANTHKKIIQHLPQYLAL
jgi:hypothetical protein